MSGHTAISVMDKKRYWPAVLFFSALLILLYSFYSVIDSEFIANPKWYSYEIALAGLISIPFYIYTLCLAQNGHFYAQFYRRNKWSRRLILLSSYGIYWLFFTVILEAGSLTYTCFMVEPASYYYTMQKVSEHRRYTNKLYYRLKLVDTPNLNFKIPIIEDQYHQLPETMTVYIEGVETQLGLFAQRYQIID